MRAQQSENEQWINWLEQESHLRGLERDEYRLLSSMLQPVHVKNGDVLFKEGESNREIFLIQNGQVNVGRSAKKHQWIDMGPFGEIDFMDDAEDTTSDLLEQVTLGPGDCVGESRLFFHHSHALTAIVAKEGDMLCLNACKIPDICAGNTNVIQCFSQLLQKSLQPLQRHM